MGRGGKEWEEDQEKKENVKIGKRRGKGRRTRVQILVITAENPTVNSTVGKCEMFCDRFTTSLHSHTLMHTHPDLLLLIWVLELGLCSYIRGVPMLKRDREHTRLTSHLCTPRMSKTQPHIIQ